MAAALLDLYDSNNATVTVASYWLDETCLAEFLKRQEKEYIKYGKNGGKTKDIYRFTENLN